MSAHEPRLSHSNFGDSIKDLKPIINDFSDLINGLVISTGGGRNGILFGPLMGLRAAEMVMSKKMSIDTSFLSIKRFSI